MDNYELTDVAKEMGFTSLDDKLQIKLEENYRGLDIVIKRLSPIGLGADEIEKDTRTFADLVKEHGQYKKRVKAVMEDDDDECFGIGVPGVWYTGYIRLTDKYQKYTIDQLEDIMQLYGGITYDHLDIDGRFTIGFDCGHFMDVSNVFATKAGLQINGDISHRNWQIWNVDRVKQQLTDAIDRLIEYGDAKDEL